MLLRRFLLLAAGCFWLTAAFVRAQTPDPVYAVMALDVASAQAAQGIVVLKAYRDAARKEAGNLGIDVLQEGGWASRFMVYETWRDRAAFDAAEKAAPLTELRDKLKPIAPAPYDRRDYKTVSVGPAKAPPPGAVFMLAHCDVVPPFLDKTLVALKEVAEAARKGEGNLRFDVVLGLGERSHSTLYGIWQNREAFDAFETAAYARRFRDTLGPFLGSPLDDRLYTFID